MKKNLVSTEICYNSFYETETETWMWKEKEKELFEKSWTSGQRI
jgi:hypothetical protein